jgi:DNA topoisomerase I
MMSAKKSLVIVESPAKARTIGKYLGPGFSVKASVGHVRDLPERELGVDVAAGFEPKYVTIRGKGRVLRDLAREARDADRILLATDPDREGEAIAYHVAEQLGYGQGNGERFQRVLFHEVTRDAVRRALDAPLPLDMRKVEAQQARRILDRLVGYQVSPLLWKPIRPGLSAGRVQTVALRLIAEREAEIRAFTPEEYWSITAHLRGSRQGFDARLHQVDGRKFRLANEEEARQVLDDVAGLPFVVSDVKRRERTKAPPAPFTTSTLQQEAAKRMGFNARQTMRVAQQLYEGVDLEDGATGLITYMRTDSTRIAASAAGIARHHLRGRFGPEYLPDSPNLWAGRQQKGAQEAHEAIRPTDPALTPERARRHLDKDQFRLYELIWLRFMAGQMSPAVYDTTTLDFELKGGGRHYLFRATGSVLKFDGFTRLYQEAREEGDHRTLDDLAPLPALGEGERVELLGITPEQHFTQPPPRFTEASLVKELEKLGIGRPSTYAQIISTLRDRKYVDMDRKRFVPTPLGETVARVLVGVFPDLFDVRFTSLMEEELDRIEEGELNWRAVLEEFYQPFEKQLERGQQKSGDIVRSISELEDESCPDCSRPLTVRWNRFGRFAGCTGYPECRFTRSLDRSDRPEPEPIGEACPECGGDLVRKRGKFGPFIGCASHPACRFTRPVTIPGLVCPGCGQGAVGEKRTRRGKPFWGCTRYPDCDWTTWDQPVAGPCPACDATFLVRKSTKARGEFLRCPQCRSEMAADAVEHGDHS